MKKTIFACVAVFSLGSCGPQTQCSQVQLGTHIDKYGGFTRDSGTGLPWLDVWEGAANGPMAQLTQCWDERHGVASDCESNCAAVDCSASPYNQDGEIFEEDWAGGFPISGDHSIDACYVWTDGNGVVLATLYD
jgi:hypothetical protein